MIEYKTKYIIDNKSYSSEIYCPAWVNIYDITNQRKLPQESIIFGPNIVKHPPIESVSYYIEKGKYVDAIHRFLYLVTIKGLPSDFMKYVQDNGLIHKLTHVEKDDILSMVNEANIFEKSVPGTFLWSLDVWNE